MATTIVILTIFSVISSALAFIDKKNKVRNYWISSILYAITTICCIIGGFIIGCIATGIATIVNLSVVYVYWATETPRG